MKITTGCMACLFESGFANPAFMEVLDLPDELAFRQVCDRGHDTFVTLQNAKFELLGQSAVEALAEGYYVEAVAGFAACLERLFEYYVDIVGRSVGVPDDIRNTIAREMSRRSEQQVGSFLTSWAIDRKTKPPTLGRAMVEFRNKVIHQGKFPSREEATLFGQAVLDVAFEVLKSLRPHEEHVRARVHADLRARSAAAGIRPDEVPSTMGWSTILDLARADYDVRRPDLDQAISEYRRRRDLLSATSSGESP